MDFRQSVGLSVEDTYKYADVNGFAIKPIPFGMSREHRECNRESGNS